MSTHARERAALRIAGLAREGLDLVTFWDAVTPDITRQVPAFASPCWFTLDPASLLITSHHNREMPELRTEDFEIEYAGDDVHCLADVCRSPAGVSTLHEAAGGDPSGSRRWQSNMELGGDQEMIVALRTSRGDAWGALTLHRPPGAPRFTREETAFAAAVAPLLAEGARTALLVAEAREPDGPDAPGLLVLSDRWEVESATPGVTDILRDLPGGDPDAGTLPPAVLSVAGRALRSAGVGADAPGEVGLARVLSRSGRWVVLHGATLVGTGGRRVAVILEQAHPARIVPLLMRAYGLTGREQEVTRLVLQGASTAEIASALVVSPLTVQEHLKRIFAKTGVRSRRELVSAVFFTHFEPRVRDNERRALEGRPLRGGPLDPGRAGGPGNGG